MSTTAVFFLVLVVIVVTCRIMHFVCRRVGQPVVVGEMIAGVMLGPTLLGALFPAAQNFLFSDDILQVLGVVSQLGLALFMFVVGLEFPTSQINRSARVGLSISASGAIIPIGLGVLFVFTFGSQLPLFNDNVGFWPGAMYLGLLLAITAFPMMARMISERGDSQSRYGTLSLTAGALDDVVAWILLAGVLAFVGVGGFSDVILAGGGFVALVAVLILLRPVFERWMTVSRLGREGVLVAGILALLVSAWFTDMIGIHAVFGAFALGAVLPRGEVSEMLIKRIRPLTVVLLLPIFFTYSGLNTDLSLIGQSGVLFGAAILMFLAFLGKFGGCTLTARVMGETWGDSTRVGCYMNARGLMQLIALNIGLEAGLITPTMFAMIVIVAIGTTLATAPGLTAIDWLEKRRNGGKPPAPDDQSLPDEAVSASTSHSTRSSR